MTNRLRVLLREEGVTFQRLKTWKASTDPDYAVKKARVEHRLRREQDRRERPPMVRCPPCHGPTVHGNDSNTA